MRSDVRVVHTADVSPSLVGLESRGLVQAYMVAILPPQHPAGGVQIATNWPAGLLEAWVGERWYRSDPAVLDFLRGDARTYDANLVREIAGRSAAGRRHLAVLAQYGIAVPALSRVETGEGALAMIALSFNDGAGVPGGQGDTLTARIAQEVLDTLRYGAGENRLTPAECDLIRAIANGLRPVRLTASSSGADRLLHEMTVSMLRKLDARTLEHAVAIAMRRGILS